MIILRLQGLPWSATAKDVRQHFEGLSIPDGGVHIIGGEEGDVFIAFSSDEDARKAMQRQKQPLNGSRIILLLSSKSEMQEVIAESRAAAQSAKPDPFGTSEIVAPSISQASQQGLLSREGSVASSHSQGYQGFSQSDDQHRQPRGYGDSYQSGNVNVPGQSLPSQGYDTSFPPSQSTERLRDYGQAQNQMYGSDRLREDSFSRGDGGQHFMYQDANRSRSLSSQERNLGIQRREDFDTARQGSMVRDSGYPQESTQYKKLSDYEGREGRMRPADVEDRQYQASSYGSASGPRSSDCDMSYMRGSDKPRGLLPSPEMMKPDERSYQEQFDDPMEGISTSYPPAGPADRFDYNQSSDETQIRGEKRGETMDTNFGSSRPMSAYGRQDMAREPDKGRFIKTPYEDAYWATTTDPPSEPMQGRRPDDTKPFPHNQNKPMPERRGDYFQGQGSNASEMRESYTGDKQYGSAGRDQGALYDQKGKPNEPFGMDRSQSAGYSMYSDYRSADKSSDFDSRMGDMTSRAPLLNQEPPMSSVKGFGNDPPSDSQVYGSRMDQEPPVSSAPAMLDQPTLDTLYGSKLQSMEPPGDAFYAVRLTGLPFSCTERDVTMFLHDINIAPDGMQIHRDHRGHITGTANVKLQGPSDIDQALKRHHQYMGKRYIDVRPCLQSEWEKEKSSASSEPSRRRSRSPVRGRKSPLRSCNTCIEIKGLPSFTKNSDIVDFFQGLSMRQDSIFFDPNRDGPGSGVAYVEFVDPDMARRACQKNGRQFNRRTVAIRIISKEIMDAKIVGDMRRRAERRSPGRRSSDRQRGSSPYSRRGRSPGRRGRSPPVRSSSRSSPGRNGPGKKQASPSRDRRDRDRDSSRQSKRALSPTRHTSQDRKDSTTEKKERKDSDSREVRSLSKGGDGKSQSSPKPEDKDRLNKSVGSKDAPPKALLPSPDFGKMQKEKGKDQGLLKTPEHTVSDSPAAFNLKQKEAVPSNTVTSQPSFSRSDERPDGANQAPVIDFHAIRDAVSRFTKDKIDWQQMEGRPGPIESRHGVPDSAQPQMGMSRGLMGEKRGAPREDLPFTGQRGPDNEYREKPRDSHSIPFDSSHGGLGENRRQSPVDMPPGSFGGPGDNRRDGPGVMQHGPFGGPGDSRRDGPMDMQTNPFGGPRDNRRDGPGDMQRGPFGGPGDKRHDGPMDMQSNPFGGPRDNRRDGPGDMQRGPFGGPGDNRRDGPMDMQSNPFGGPRDNRRDGPGDMQRGPFGGPGDNRRDGPMDKHPTQFGGPGENRRDDPQDMQRGPFGGPGENRREVPPSIQRGPHGGPQDNRRDDPMDMQRGPFGSSGDNRRNGPIDMQRGAFGGPEDNMRNRRLDMQPGPFGGPGDSRRDAHIDVRRESGMSDARGRMQDSWQGGPGPGRPNDDIGESHMQDTRGRSLEEWRRDHRRDMDGSMDMREGRPNEERRRTLIEDKVPGQHRHHNAERRTLLDRPEEPHERYDERDDDQRRRGFSDRQDTGRMDEKGLEARNRRDSSPRRRTGNQSEERFSGESFDFPGQVPVDRSRGRNGPTSRDVNRDSFPVDQRNLPPEQGDHPFPQGRNLPGLLERYEGERERRGPDNQGPRDPHGQMERHRGPQDGPDRRSVDRGMHGAGEPPQGPLDRPHDDARPHDGTSEYVCAHIRNVPYSARWPDIAQFFNGLQIVPGGIHIMVNSNGRPSGQCFIEFVDAHNARLTEERRLHKLKDRPLQVNACSKAMMIRALEQGGEMLQNRPQHNFGGRGRGSPFGPRGPRFQGDMRGPAPGQGPQHNFGPRGPHPGGSFRPPFEEPRRMDDHPPQHRMDDHPPPHRMDDHPPPHRMDDHPPPHRTGDHPPPHRMDDHPPQHRMDDHPPQYPHDPGHSRRSRQEHDYKNPEPSKEPTKEEASSKGPASAPKATPPDPSPKKPQPEAPKEAIPEAKEKKSSSVSVPTPSAHMDNKHKGCVVTATNLPLTITVDAIGDFFKGFSTIKGAIKLDTNEATGKATGQAKIVFTSPSEANRAIKERNNRPLNGRIVRLHVL